MASGLGGLLAAGQKTKEQAKAGMLGAAKLEAQKDIAERGLKTQKEAGEQQLMGMGAGIGAYAASGTATAASATAATAAAAQGAGAVGTAVAQGGAILGAIAGPVLIGVAAAALLNKLFD